MFSAEEMYFPRPHRHDENDVVWALETARVQWDRGARADAVVWIRRASDAALQTGAQDRAGELKATAEALVDYLWSDAPALEEEPTAEELLPMEVAVDEDGSAVEDVQVAVEPVQSEANFDESRSPKWGGDVPDEEETRPLERNDPAYADVTREVARLAQRVTVEEPEEEIEEIDPASLRTLPPDESEAAVNEDLEVLRLAFLEARSDGEILGVASLATEPGLAAKADDPALPRAQVADVVLDEVPGFQDLPGEVQLHLARVAKLNDYETGQDIVLSGAALVLSGQLTVMQTGSHVTAAVIAPGGVAYAQGSLVTSIGLRFVASAPTRLASWSRDDLDRQMRDYPWVSDEFRRIGDRYQALAGVVLGPLGQKLDESLRVVVTDRLQAIALKPGEMIVAAGQRVPGFHLLGVGAIEILGSDEETVESILKVGEFLFASEEMSASPAPRTARAGTQGAVVLFGQRQIAHELLTSVPPLIELLTS